MKKTIHLVCNAHIDPVWQWDWNEGASAALATFYSAVKLFENHDYVFNHNEVLIYEYIEKNDPELFKKIQELVKIGKWKIMGGWYVQPDCMVPSGESFIRQITLGREYFKEKFNVYVTAANNFDSFAHTRGLATILNKCGYESYIFCRPMPHHDLYSKNPLPNGPFLWKGYDGSTIKALRFDDENIYLSEFGKAVKEITRKINHYPNDEHVCVLWGIGNHGGGASSLDLDNIKTFQEEKKDEMTIIHSTLEDYFKNVHPTKIVDRQLICLFKSYSSISAIKQAHDDLENALYLTEKACSIADLEGVYHYDKEILKEAEKTLCRIAFHDVLSGTAIKTGTDSSIRAANHAMEILNNEFFASFSALASRLPKVTPNDENLVIFNPNPYDYDDIVCVEFYALPSIRRIFEYHYQLTFYDKNHNIIPHQIIKEESELNSDRRKRAVFKIKIPACSVVSIGVHKDVINSPKPKYIDESSDDIIVKDNIKTVKISRKSGLLESFNINGKEYLAAPSVIPNIFNDNEDPWGWYLTRFDEKHDLYNVPYTHSNAFKRMKSDNSSKGVFKDLKAVTVLNDGSILTEVQSLFSSKDSHVIINYKIYKNEPYIDIHVHTLWNETKKGLKIEFNPSGPNAYFAQAAFGIEKYKADGKEQPSNRYVGVNNNNDALVIYNKSGIHSVAKKGKRLTLTLFNGSVYCAHPIISDRPIIANKERFIPYAEQGLHDHFLRLRVNKLEECERFAKEFNESVYGLYYFPHGEGNETKNTIVVSNKNVIITALKRRNDGTFLIRLYNGSFDKTSTNIAIKGINKEIKFNKFEFKTLVFDKEKIIESKDASIY